jgi:hypothetical protein
MSQREVENKECKECESFFRISFDPTEASGYPKFCCFCGGDLHIEDISEDSDEE